MARHSFSSKALWASRALASSIFTPPMARYTPFHPPRDLWWPSPDTSSGMTKSCQDLLESLEVIHLQALCT
ncbi:hypothetical protein B0H14DRAFT_1451295 [Mycena olivaceomarginata]|nr:hypothetical protein B0H14DRAFT_1451295 [Mycena olivaceomarginata]